MYNENKNSIGFFIEQRRICGICGKNGNILYHTQQNWRSLLLCCNKFKYAALIQRCNVILILFLCALHSCWFGRIVEKFGIPWPQLFFTLSSNSLYCTLHSPFGWGKKLRKNFHAHMKCCNERIFDWFYCSFSFDLLSISIYIFICNFCSASVPRLNFFHFTPVFIPLFGFGVRSLPPAFNDPVKFSECSETLEFS